MRRTARGELSELFGADTLPIDKFFRRLGIRGYAQEAYEKLSDEDKEIA